MKKKKSRDIEKEYPRQQFIAKLRRLADALETNEPFSIQVGNERLHIPTNAIANIEHERSDKEEELEFQLKWTQ
ncbi:MAG: amphi-Trp domain-containing protein [Bacteroidota bacterium]